MIRAAKEDEIRAVADILHYRPSAQARGVVLQSVTLDAMVIFDRWSYNGAEAHVYSAKPGALLNREFLRESFAYLFNFCNRGVCVSVTPGDNEASLRVSKALGFTEVHRIPDYWSVGVPMVIKEMRKENCVWIKELH